MDKQLLNRIVKLQKQAETEPVTITLDWLSIYFTQQLHFATKIEENQSIKLSENCFLVSIDKPTLHFNTHLVLIYEGEECAHLLLNSKNEKFFANDIVKVEIKNHALYSGAWLDVINCLLDFGLKYKAAGRIDIAIDGMNSMHQLMNLYAKQTVQSKTLLLKNSSAARARFSAKVLNPKTMLFENFNIGGSGGNKMITVYNKSLEIVKSGKKYIQEFWLRNGLIDGLKDLDEQAAEIEKWEAKGYETFHLEGFKNIYRFEIRLKSESIKEIEHFDLEMLTTASGLASIVKLHCRKFFEPILNDAPKTNDCSAVSIIPYARLQAVPLNKITRQETDGVYKAKLTIHGIVQDLYRSRIQTENINDVIAAIFDRVDRYKLASYLEKKLIEWDRRYSNSIPVDCHTQIYSAIHEIDAKLAPYLERFEEAEDLSDRHGQSGATAFFGEGIFEAGLFIQV